MGQVRVNDYPLPAKDRDMLRSALGTAWVSGKAGVSLPLLHKELKAAGYEHIVRCPGCILYSTCAIKQFAGGYCGNGLGEEIA